ncbi:helix-turn-helix domain-containing protein [Streptomonospora salina]|uniref:Transcriptional regulator with XRE-family HTH domain n=1 Tax=Streptomonospora salina TaxID=104205 RepID=A0A841EIH7_9ACTN|nr:helix-turn-helix transcriptional regulator [Streptomonospora salina]MBB6000160.1 transcriptional regulator with XRE-family HTH domain [Streptomonospora salina]
MRQHLDVEALYAALDSERRTRELSWRQLAKEMQVSPSLLSRLSNGLRPDVDSFATLVRWLGVPAEQFLVNESEEPVNRPEPELVTQIGPLLRARRDLTPDDVSYIEEIVQATVRRVRAPRRDQER